MIDAFYGRIASSFSWIFCSFVSPLETKGNQRKTLEIRGNQRKTIECHRIHPAPNQRKPKETKGNQRKPKETEGNQIKVILASSFVFRVSYVSFGFLSHVRAIFWCNPCVGKVDTASFWPIT
jgi:hypothetical protein